MGIQGNLMGIQRNPTGNWEFWESTGNPRWIPSFGNIVHFLDPWRTPRKNVTWNGLLELFDNASRFYLPLESYQKADHKENQ